MRLSENTQNPTPNHRSKKCTWILGVRIDKVDMAETVAKVEQFIAARTPLRIIYTPNLDFLAKMRTDREFREIVNSADLSVSDGMGLVYAAKIRGDPVPGLVGGRRLFEQLCAVAADRGYKIFLMGAGPGVVQQASVVLQHRFPAIKIAGVFTPPYFSEAGGPEGIRMIEAVNRSGADILFIGLGSPKQERWIYYYRKQLQVPVVIGVGASFDLMAGRITTPPKWVTDAGFEWVYRLAAEPRRLWRRYTVEMVKLAPLLVKAFLNQRMGTVPMARGQQP